MILKKESYQGPGRVANAYLFFFIIFICMPLELYSLDHVVFGHPVDKDTEEGLNEVMKRLQTKKIITSDFKQTKSMKVLQKPLISSGRFVFAKNSGLCWKTEKPFDMAFVITDKKMMQIEDGKVTLDVSMAKQPLIHGMTSVFKSMFNGDIKKLKKHFSIYFHKEGEKWTVGLKPKKRKMKKFFRSIILKGNLYIEKVIILEKNQDLTNIEFVNHTSPEKLTPSDKSTFEK